MGTGSMHARVDEDNAVKAKLLSHLHKKLFNHNIAEAAVVNDVRLSGQGVIGASKHTFLHGMALIKSNLFHICNDSGVHFAQMAVASHLGRGEGKEQRERERERKRKGRGRGVRGGGGGGGKKGDVIIVILL